MNPEFEMIFDSAPRDDIIIATYTIRLERDADVLAQIGTLARFVYPGTGGSVPGISPEGWNKYGAHVLGVYETPPAETDLPHHDRPRWFVAQIALPVELAGDSLAMLLTLAAGEIQAYGHAKLVDLSLPQRYAGQFLGPKFGVQGLRDLLGLPRRPLLLGIFKPSQGLPAQESAAFFYEAAAGGVDIIKDDELLSDPSFCRRADRVRHYQQAAQRAYEETGEKTLHAVNITGRADRLLQNALEAVELGTNALMINYLQVGLDAARSVCEDPRITVPVLGHNSGASSLYSSTSTGMSVVLINSRLPRLCGLDMCILLSDLGKFRMLKETAVLAARDMRATLYHLRPMLPVAAGGITPDLIGTAVSQYGTDMAIGVGAAIFGHPDGPRAGAHLFRQHLDQALIGMRYFSG